MSAGYTILVADKVTLDGVTVPNANIVTEAALKDDALEARIAELQPTVLIVRSTKVREAHILASGSLQLIIRAGAGVNNIDLDCASSRGVFVCNCPGMNAAATCEAAWAHILNADRRLADGVAELRAGQWNKAKYSKNARGIKSSVLGVIGCGNIGREVIVRGKAFGMDVVAWSRSLTPERAAALGVRAAGSPAEVAAQCDVLTVHVDLTDDTRGFINADVLGALHEGAIFVNTSRGEVVDEAALIAAVQEKGIRAGLDVFCNEPSGSTGEWTNELIGLEGVYGTHHCGASTDEAQKAVADETVRIINTYYVTGDPPNCVNLADQTPARTLLVVRHEDKVGVLATVLSTLKGYDINVQGMENIVFNGARAACARIQVDSDEIPEEAVAELRGNDAVYAVSVKAL